MDRREELEQQLWEFVFDLLAPEQAQAIHQRITCDPEVARLYAETKLQADIVGEAVKLRHPPISLTAPDPNNDATSRDGVSACVERSRRFPTKRFGNWFATIAAALLLCYLGYAYYQPASPIRDVAFQSAESALVNQPVRTTVLGAEQLQPSSVNYITVMTKTATGQPREADVDVRFYATDGEMIQRGTCRTDARGIGQLETAGFAPSASVRMEVEPVSTVGGFPLASVNFSVRDEELSTHLASDRSLYRPGESIQYRSVTLARYDLKAPAPTCVEFSILDPQGAMVEGSKQTVETEQGVGSGAFVLPAERPFGRYELVARSPENRFAEQRRGFQVRPYRTPKLKKKLDFALDSYAPGEQVVADLTVERIDGQTVRNTSLEIVAQIDDEVCWNMSTATDDQGKYQIRFDLPQQLALGKGLLQVTVGDDLREQLVEPIPINIESASVEFFPESGDLVAGVENRVYFFAHDPQDKPVHVQGRIVDDRGSDVASVRTIREGRGVFWFTPTADTTYLLELQTPVALASDPALPGTSQRQFVVLDTGGGVFDADSPLELDLRSSRSDRLVLVAAVCRGRQVGQAMVSAEQFAAAGTGAACPVSMELDENASGVVRLTAYDFAAFPPEPIAERLVYRRPRSQLDFDISGRTSGLAPGSQVDLSLSVRDERGQRRSAVLGVSVVDEAALSLLADGSASLTTHFWLTGQIDDLRGLEDANFCLQDDQQAAESLDLLLGTQGWRRFEAFPLDQFAALGADAPFGDSAALAEASLGLVADEPTAPQLLADNQRYAIGAVSRDLDSLRSSFESGLRRVGRVLFFGGLALVISLVLLAVMRRATATVWIPALGAGALCLVLGGVWITTQIQRSNPLAGLLTAEIEPTVYLAQIDSKSERERTEMRRLSETPESDEAIERYAIESEVLRDEELEHVELQMLEQEMSDQDILMGSMDALGGKRMPAAPRPAAKPASRVTDENKERFLGRDAAAEFESGKDAPARSAVAAPETRGRAAMSMPSTASKSSQVDRERVEPSLGVPSTADLAANDKLEMSRRVTEKKKDMNRRPFSSAAPERTAGIGGGVAGQPADTPARAKIAAPDAQQVEEDLAEDGMFQSFAEKVPVAPAPERPSEPLEELVLDAERRFERRGGEVELLSRDDSVRAGMERQLSDEAMTPEFDVSLDKRTLAFSDLAAGEPATSVAMKRGQLAADADMATQGLAGSRTYEFQPLVRRYATRRETGSDPDLTETVYWNPLLIADPDAPVALRFQLPDAEATYRLLINGHSDGRLGRYRDAITVAPSDGADAKTDVAAEDGR